MAENSKISWTDTTWQPVVGCTRISPGCRGCYAARMAKRQAGMARAKRAKGQDPGRSAHYEKIENWDDVALVPEALGDPLRWRKARRVFVCSMSDLFHEGVPTTYITHVFEVMANVKHCTFQVLTKRPERMRDYILKYWDRMGSYLSHVHLGVTAENQAMADERIPVLLRIPAAFRFVSLEPLLGEIELPRDCFDVCACGHHMETHQLVTPHGVNGCMWGDCKCQDFARHGLDLVIVGGETGPGARPMHPAWPRSLRDQCADADVPFHFKSHGEWLDALACAQMGLLDGRTYPCRKWPDGSTSFRVGAKRAGHRLDGVEYRDLPGHYD